MLWSARSSRSCLPAPWHWGRLVSAMLAVAVLAACSGPDPVGEDQRFPFPSISDSASPRPDPSQRIDVEQVNARLNSLLANDIPSPEEVNELTKLADQVLAGAADRINMTPEAFARLTPEQVADMVQTASQHSRHAVQVSLEELRKMTPQQRALIAQSAAVVTNGLVEGLANDAKAALGNRAAVVRIGVNELGGYAASAAYLWVYLLHLAGYNTQVEIGSGAILAEKLNANELDVTFEAVPEFLEVDTAALGVWSNGRLNVQGRADLGTDLPEVADGLTRFALDHDQMASLAAVVRTRGVADPATQEAAVQLWLVDHPELLQRLAGQ